MWYDVVDKIFVINTNNNIGYCRYEYFIKQFYLNPIPYVRYDAIENENGELGLLKTMKQLFNECYENNYSQVLVFEDDATIIVNEFNDIMQDAIKQLPTDFLCLYLGCNLLVPPVKLSKNILQIRAAYSSHSILYSKKGIDLILSLWKENQPYDNFLMTEIQPYGNCFCTYPILCSQRIGESSIFKYDPKKQIGIEKYYNVATNEIDWGLLMKEQFNLMTKNL